MLHDSELKNYFDFDKLKLNEKLYNKIHNIQDIGELRLFISDNPSVSSYLLKRGGKRKSKKSKKSRKSKKSKKSRKSSKSSKSSKKTRRSGRK